MSNESQLPLLKTYYAERELTTLYLSFIRRLEKISVEKALNASIILQRINEESVSVDFWSTGGYWADGILWKKLTPSELHEMMPFFTKEGILEDIEWLIKEHLLIRTKRYNSSEVDPTYSYTMNIDTLVKLGDTFDKEYLKEWSQYQEKVRNGTLSDTHKDIIQYADNGKNVWYLHHNIFSPSINHSQIRMLQDCGHGGLLESQLLLWIETMCLDEQNERFGFLWTKAEEPKSIKARNGFYLPAHNIYQVLDNLIETGLLIGKKFVDSESDGDYIWYTLNYDEIDKFKNCKSRTILVTDRFTTMWEQKSIQF